MNLAAVWAVVSRFLPKSRIGAWLLGLVAIAMSTMLAVSPQELKDKFCAAPVVELPSAPADAPVK